MGSGKAVIDQEPCKVSIVLKLQVQPTRPCRTRLPRLARGVEVLDSLLQGDLKLSAKQHAFVNRQSAERRLALPIRRLTLGVRLQVLAHTSLGRDDQGAHADLTSYIAHNTTLSKSPNFASFYRLCGQLWKDLV